jgi:hypothetical protein
VTVRGYSSETTQLLIVLKLVGSEVRNALISHYNKHKETQYCVECRQLYGSGIQKQDNNSRVSEVKITMTFIFDHE